MSTKRSVNEIIMKKMPEKGMVKNKGIDATGLHKRPQMMQIVNYLENGQEKMTYPDREAKLIRNHPFMTQLDFFDMQEDQQRAWAGEERKKEAEQVATEQGDSAAIGAATAPRPAREPPQAPPPPPPGPNGPSGGGGGSSGSGGGGGGAGGGAGGGGSSGSGGGGDAGGKGGGKGPDDGKKKDNKPDKKGPGGGGGRTKNASNIKRMAADGSVLVDPMMSAQPAEAAVNETTDTFAEMGGFTERSYLGKMGHIAAQNAYLLTNRSHVPDAMPDDDPIPTSDGKFHRKIGKIGQPYASPRGHKRILDSIGLDGETFKHYVGTAASASGSAAATAGGYLATGAVASGSAVAAVAARGAQGMSNIAGAAGYYGPIAARNLGNNTRDSARIVLGGTGAVLNFAASSAGTLMNIASQNITYTPMTDEQHAVYKHEQYQDLQRRKHHSAIARANEAS